jgi:hypothetical protein
MVSEFTDINNITVFFIKLHALQHVVDITSYVAPGPVHSSSHSLSLPIIMVV